MSYTPFFELSVYNENSEILSIVEKFQESKMKFHTVANKQTTNYRYKSLGTWTDYIVVDDKSEVINKGDEMIIRNGYELTKKQFENGKLVKSKKMLLVKKPSQIIEKHYGWNFEEKDIEMDNVEII